LITSLPSERAARKRLGAFYSPETLVGPITSWAIRSISDRVLDPSCGDGVFLAASAQRLHALGAGVEAIGQQLAGFDINPRAVAKTRETLSIALGGSPPQIELEDFFSTRSPDQLSPIRLVDALIGNPPYIRYQQFSGKMRAAALQRAAEAGVVLPQLVSSWAPFVAHALSFLRPEGRLALILPAELAHAKYADPVRHQLLRCFRDVTVVSFDTAVFPRAQVEVVVLLADGFRANGDGLLRLLKVNGHEDLQALNQLVAKSHPFNIGQQPRKWLRGFEATAGSRCLDDLAAGGKLVPLSAVGKANIGFVSGANEFFVLTAEEVAQRKLPSSSLRPSIIRARQMPGCVLTKRELSTLRERGDRSLLWLPHKKLTASERSYVEHGKRMRVHRRYKCRTRDPWYVVPGVRIPEALLTYMSDGGPRLCLNSANVVASNTLLAIQLRLRSAALREAVVAAFYNSATLLSCELVGRSYGGGVLKLEPREADTVLIPAPGLLAPYVADLRQALTDLDRCLRAERGRGLQGVIDIIDRIVLQDVMGVERSKIRELQDTRRDLIGRRKARATSARANAVRCP
jgi:adenine-specific DNA methylase